MYIDAELLGLNVCITEWKIHIISFWNASHFKREQDLLVSWKPQLKGHFDGCLLNTQNQGIRARTLFFKINKQSKKL